jgi:hypothetical protein
MALHVADCLNRFSDLVSCGILLVSNMTCINLLPSVPLCLNFKVVKSLYDKSDRFL